MKNAILAITFFIGITLNAQNYVVDPTFGTNGKVVTDFNIGNGNNQVPQNCFYLNGKYIFVQKNQISAVNYDGSADLTFGISGCVRLTDATLKYTILNSKVIDNFIYLSGLKANTAGSVNFAFVARLSADGIFDTSFGVGGIAVFSTGAVAIIPNSTNDNGVMDFVVKDGAIYTTGSVSVTGTAFTKIFVAKLSLSGTVDTAFDALGYKIYSICQNNKTKGIFSYENDLLLAISGRSIFSQAAQTQTLKGLIKIDGDGNFVTGFGTGGVKIIDVCTGCNASGESINKITLTGNFLYMLTTHSEAAPWNWRKLQRINIATTETENIANTSYSEGDYLVDNDKIYILGCDNSNSETTQCPYDFNLSRRNLNGTLDTTFNLTGRFSLNFESAPNSNDKGSVLIKHPDGRIMMGGYTYGAITTAPHTGFAIARIVDELLQTDNFNMQHYFSVAPNPVENTLNVNNAKNEAIESISISDASGKIVYESNTGETAINVERLDGGMYFMKINSRDKTAILKFIKK